MYILTNNPKVLALYAERYEVRYEACDYDGILEIIRDRVHTGAHLLTHPLAGSVKPKETPYRSVLMEEGSGAVDAQSLALIESAIASAKKFRNKSAGYDEKVLEDCQVVDSALLAGALGSYGGLLP